MNYSRRRYSQLWLILHETSVTTVAIARQAKCSQANVGWFILGKHNSLRVARAMARLTNRPEDIATITGLPVHQLTREEAA